MTDADLKKIFQRFGKVESARIITSSASGDSKGYGFVQMSDADQARTAINTLNSEEVKGRRIVVSVAKTPARNHRG